MPYAEGRIFNDADSHVMETRDWMTRYADPGIRERLAPLDLTVGRRRVPGRAGGHRGGESQDQSRGGRRGRSQPDAI